MTETTSTTTPTPPVFPAGRYGRRRAAHKRRPWLVTLLAVAALAVGTLISVRLYVNYGDPAYDAQVITFTDITDDGVTIVFRVTVPPDGTAVCAVRGRARDGAEIGRAEVPVPAAADGSAEATYRLATSGRAMIGEVLRCRAA